MKYTVISVALPDATLTNEPRVMSFHRVVTIVDPSLLYPLVEDEPSIEATNRWIGPEPSRRHVASELLV